MSSTAKDYQALMRDRLIESRLTPNAISLTGFALCVVAAVLVWQDYFFLGGIAFIVGSALAGFGGVIGGSFASLAPGVDANWLLYSLVVVIIGGMGSLGGAAIGALLLGLTSNFSAAYLPANYTYYSIIFTFVLVAFVLAVRPLGLFGRPA